MPPCPTHLRAVSQAYFLNGVAEPEWHDAAAGNDGAHGGATVATSSVPPPPPPSSLHLLAAGRDRVPTLEARGRRRLPHLPSEAWQAIAQAALVAEGREVAARDRLSRVCTTWRHGLQRACDHSQAPGVKPCTALSGCTESSSRPVEFVCLNGSRTSQLYLSHELPQHPPARRSQDYAGCATDAPLKVTLGYWGAPTYAGDLLPPGCPLHSLDFGPSSLQSGFDWVR